jgi:hypothetical protein
MFPLSVLENMQPAENIQQSWDLTSLTGARYQNYRQQAGGYYHGKIWGRTPARTERVGAFE